MNDDPLGPLPSDWSWREFRDVARVASNLVDPLDHLQSPHIAPNHIEAGLGHLLPYSTVGEDGVTSPKHAFRAGQILYSKIRPYLAKVAIVDFDGLCSADMYPIETSLNTRYLKWWMLHPDFTRRASGEQARTVLPKINKSALGRLPIPVAPVEEQRRIVEILEGHLSRLDAADTTLSVARQRLDALTQSVIDHATTQEIPEYPLKELLSQPLVNGRSVPTEEGGFPVLRLTALKDPGVDLAERKGGAWKRAQAQNFLVSAGDFLVARGNGSLRLVGRGSLVRDVPDEVAFPDTMIRVRTNPDRLDAEYLSFVWSSRRVRSQLEGMARTTAGIYKVNQTHVGEVRFALPERSEQLSVVEQVRRNTGSNDRLRSQFERTRERSAALRRAVLAAAFSGRLTGHRTDDEVIEELAQA